MKFKLKPQQNHHLYVPLIIHLLTGMDITVVKQTRKDQLSWKLLHKMKLMMEHVTVWISTDKVDVANLNVLLAHMDLDVLTILLVNNYLIYIKDFPCEHIIQLKFTKEVTQLFYILWFILISIGSFTL